MAVFRHIRRPALLPFSMIYGLGVLIRNVLFDLRVIGSTQFRIPIISVGNITVGGTGKTPHVEFLVQLLKNDFKVAVLSRGYKRKTSHFILASRNASVNEIGDEPLQIKLKFPDVKVAVEKDRVRGVKTLIKSVRNLEMIILDDAYQHRYIRPGLSILLVDYNRPVFRDVLLPAGNLREPTYGIRRADILIVTKCPDDLTPAQRSYFIARLHPGTRQEIFFTRYSYGSPIPVFPDKNENSELTYKHLMKTDCNIMLVTGIANPTPLRKYLKEITNVNKEMHFPDHHQFTHSDIQRIQTAYKNMVTEEKYIFVTEKDAVRLRESEIHDKNLKHALYYIPIEVKFMAKGEKPFIKKIYKYLSKSNDKVSKSSK